MSVRLRIAESSQVFDAPEGEDLLELLQRNNYPIATSCGGVASCGLCRVTIVSGKQFLSHIKTAELNHLGNVAKVIGSRLACQTHIGASEDGEEAAIVEVSVPPVEDTEERKRRKSERLRAEKVLLRESERIRIDQHGQRKSGRSAVAPPAAPPSEEPRSDPGSRPRELIEWRPRVVRPKQGE